MTQLFKKVLKRELALQETVTSWRVMINRLFSYCWLLKYSCAHGVFVKWQVLTAASSLWPSRALLLSPLVTHLTMWPISECSCLPCDSRDATNSTINTHNEIREEDREGLFNGWEGGRGERAGREKNNAADRVRQKVQKSSRRQRDIREVNVGSSKTQQDKSETEGSLVEQMDVSVHEWTDGNCLCVEWQMSKTCKYCMSHIRMLFWGLLLCSVRFYYTAEITLTPTP